MICQTPCMWVHIIRLLDDEEQAKKVLQIFKQAMNTRAIETDLSARDRAQHVGRTSDLVAAELAGLDSLKGVTDLQRRQQRVVINNEGGDQQRCLSYAVRACTPSGKAPSQRNGHGRGESGSGAPNGPGHPPVKKRK